MMSFSAKKLEKNNIAVWGNTSNSIKWPQKFHNYVLQLYLTSDQKKKKKKYKNAFISEIFILMPN